MINPKSRSLGWITEAAQRLGVHDIALVEKTIRAFSLLEAFILKALEQHGKLSRPEVNALLMNKLPEALTEKQKKYKIGNLLAALRRAGKIELGEQKMWRRKYFS